MPLAPVELVVHLRGYDDRLLPSYGRTWRVPNGKPGLTLSSVPMLCPGAAWPVDSETTTDNYFLLWTNLELN